MRVLFLIVCTALVAGCDGGGNKDSAAVNPAGSGPPAPTQSPGGIWMGIPGASESITFYIAETGELIVQTTALGATPPSFGFGTGAVIVNNPNDVAGTYRLRTLPSGPAFVTAQPEQPCTMDGTVTERSLLQVTVSCTDGVGSTTDRTLSMLYNPAYELDSALADIGGNYTVPFRPQTNTLNINASGVVFGMLDNGPTCTVNGQVQIIDSRFNLYRFEIQLSLCQGLSGPVFEGTTFRGFAARNLPGMRTGAFLLLLTSTTTVSAPIQFFSLLYEPV